MNETDREHSLDAIKGIIFDWGGVLIDDPVTKLMQHCAQALSVTPQRFSEAHDCYACAFQKGDISEGAFWDAICARLGTPASPATSLWTEAFRAAHRPRPTMLRLIQTLRRRGYRTALLSNTETPAVEFFQREYPQDLFDALVFSCSENCRKPERRIYTLALERLQTRPEQTIFIDDREENLHPARAMAMHVIRADNSDAVLQGLEDLGVQIP